MHLVVVQHGLWGYPANTAYLSLLLRERLGHGYFVLNSDVNSGNLTYDGIDVCGDRLYALVQKTMQSLTTAGSPVSAISMIGYSMGGLILRYVAGKLYAEGVFDSITPVNFITVATPHLGAWRMPSNWFNRAFNYMVPVVTSRSGYQLVLQDKHTWGKPLLCLMSHPDLLFMRALRKFKKLMLLANVFHDRPVPYCTAAIRLDNPYEESPPVPIDPKYPSIVMTAAANATAAVATKIVSNGAAAVKAVAVGVDATVAAPPSSGPEAAIVQVSEPAPTPSAAPRRPLRSTYLPILFLVFLPLALPAFGLMILTGRAHHRKIMRTALDFSWIQQHQMLNAVDSDSATKMQTQIHSVTTVPLAGPNIEQQSVTSGKSDSLPSGIECPSAPDLAQRSSSKTLSVSPAMQPAAAEARAGTGAVSATVAPASSTAAGALDDGADGVVVSEQSVLLHDGIVELPAELHHVQEWLVEQLNTLPWHKVDVDCRDLHAHAAIIMRNPSRFKHNKDVLGYLIDQFLRI
ncbi:hypothetical protein Vretimale_124 [Volvox reticuliferus]|uniref:DUF676 domain-containing protein n=1 Tax=Volvox reticuliferus TaxID=1737510 RepID=A0A8J4G2E2_9CHLO|nr:hypothetical protein Vretifemale_8282 [Volvox reticuliferus]GIL93894.1 hypothetical protein Vretimale_124 [Volvox reticuliferus]